MEEKIEKLITQRQFQRTAALDRRCKVALLISIGCVSYFLNGEVAVWRSLLDLRYSSLLEMEQNRQLKCWCFISPWLT